MAEKPPEADKLAEELSDIPAGELWRASARELGSTIKQIKKEAVSQRRRARRNRLAHFVLLGIIAFLSVVAPILVTYQTIPDSSTALQVLAVVATALTGVAATLQGTLRLHERYRHATLTALELDDLLANAIAELQNARTDEMDPFSELNMEMRRELNHILRADIEAEVTTAVKRDGPAQGSKAAVKQAATREGPAMTSHEYP
jgi:hypothetical protein